MAVVAFTAAANISSGVIVRRPPSQAGMKSPGLSVFWPLPRWEFATVEAMIPACRSARAPPSGPVSCS